MAKTSSDLSKDQIVQLVDLGGEIHAKTKQLGKDLEKIKATIRELAKAGKLEVISGSKFEAKASSHITTTVDVPSAIFNYIGIRPAMIDPDEKYTLTGRQLALLLDAVTFSVPAIRRDFTEATAGLLLTEAEKQFHTISFNKLTSSD